MSELPPEDAVWNRPSPDPGDRASGAKASICWPEWSAPGCSRRKHPHSRRNPRPRRRRLYRSLDGRLGRPSSQHDEPQYFGVI